MGNYQGNVWQSKQCCKSLSIKKDISNLQQEGKPFVQLVGSMKSRWNELETYRPHTTDSSMLLKRAEEDKIFQLLSSLDSEYEDL